MKNNIIKNSIFIFMFGSIFLIYFLINSGDDIEDKKSISVNIITISMEQAYFEGQADAISGDVRIKKLNNGKFVWTKSPWDSGKKPIFDTLKQN